VARRRLRRRHRLARHKGQAPSPRSAGKHRRSASTFRPIESLELRTTAKLLTEGVAPAVGQIAKRYLGGVDGAAYAESMSDDLFIRLEPGRLRTWDFADEFEVAG
jgi:hypothetical protein